MGACGRAEKEAVMTAFRQGEYDLVAMTVVKLVSTLPTPVILIKANEWAWLVVPVVGRWWARAHCI